MSFTDERDGEREELSRYDDGAAYGYSEQQREIRAAADSSPLTSTSTEKSAQAGTIFSMIVVGLLSVWWFIVRPRRESKTRAMAADTREAIIQELLADESKDDNRKEKKSKNAGKQNKKQKKRNNNKIQSTKMPVASTEPTPPDTTNARKSNGKKQQTRTVQKTLQQSSPPTEPASNAPEQEDDWDCGSSTNAAAGRIEQEDEEERIIQQVIEASLRDSPVGIETELGQQLQLQLLEEERKLKQEQTERVAQHQSNLRREKQQQGRKRETAEAEMRRQEADQARIQKQKKRDAELARNAKREKQKAEQSRLQKRQELQAKQAKQIAERRQFWEEQAEIQDERVAKLVRLLAFECCRTDANISHQDWLSQSLALLNDAHKLEAQARKIYRDLWLFDEQLRSGNESGGGGGAVVVKGRRRRNAVIQEWDESKGKFRVAFSDSTGSTKKANKLQFEYLLPEHLELQRNATLQATCQPKEKPDIFSIKRSSLLAEDDDDEEEILIHIDNATIDDLLQAKIVDDFLVSHGRKCYEEERQAKHRDAQERTTKEQADRRAFWMEHIQFEQERVEMIKLLLVTEFCRTTSRAPAFRATLLRHREVIKKLDAHAKQIFLELYDSQMPKRVVVKGSPPPHQNLDGRVGAIERWDQNKGAFLVVLEAKKKGKNGQTVNLPPDYIEALPNKSSPKKKERGQRTSLAFITSLYNGECLLYEIEKTIVEEIVQAKSVDNFLDVLVIQRDEDEKRAKQVEEEERMAEEEAKRRRAEKLQREEREWRRQKAEIHERTERLKEMRRKRKMAQQEARAEYQSNVDEVAEDEEEGASYHQRESRSCDCPECRERDFIRHLFEEVLRGRSAAGGPSFFFHGGSGFFFEEDDYDSEYDDEERWDEEFERMHNAELAEKNAKAAEVLGVEEDATEGEINRKFRRLSLLYHPDKYHPDNHEDGSTKEEVEERFKLISEAREEMLLYRERTA